MKINDHVSCCEALEAGGRKNILFSSPSYSPKKYIIQGFDGAERGKEKGKHYFYYVVGSESKGGKKQSERCKQ